MHSDTHALISSELQQRQSKLNNQLHVIADILLTSLSHIVGKIQKLNITVDMKCISESSN